MRFGGSEMRWGRGRKGGPGDARRGTYILGDTSYRVGPRVVYFGRLSKHVWPNVKHKWARNELNRDKMKEKNEFRCGSQNVNVLEVIG